MKFNYRDKIIAGVLLAIVILLVGFFVPIKNMNAKNKTDKKTLADKQKIKTEYETKIAQIPSIQESIKSIYNEANDASEVFVPLEDIKNQVEVDKYMQKYADECKVKISNLDLGASAIAPLDYYFSSVQDTFGKLREQADINGNLSKEYAESVAESTALSQRAKENVIRTQYAMSVSGTKQNIWKYLEAIKKFDKAVVINSVNLKDSSFGKNAAEDAGVQLPESKDGEEVSVTADNGTITNVTDATIIMSLYSVIRMEEPNVESE